LHPAIDPSPAKKSNGMQHRTNARFGLVRNVAGGAPRQENCSMLTSLFGDLGAARQPTGSEPPGDGARDPGFAATPIMQRVDTVVDEHGRMVDHHVHDLVVSGSPAQAIREHFVATRPDLETASRIITLLDPVGMWASAVVHALSDAGGRPIEKLHLREKDSLRTLAVIERTTLARRNEETLTVYHAEVRAPGRENAEIPIALMERSHMSAVIVGPRQPHAIDALLDSLREATALPTWRCPNLLFILPPDATWIAAKVGSIVWPGSLRVHLLNESLSSASAVWNAMLGMWNHVKSARNAIADPAAMPAPGRADIPSAAAAPSTEPIRATLKPATPTPAVPRTPVPRRRERADFADTEPFVVMPDAAEAAPLMPVLTPVEARRALAALLSLEGLLGCAIVDLDSGALLAGESAITPAIDLAALAAACAQVCRAQRQFAGGMGFSQAPDESAISAGTRRVLVVAPARRPELLIVALIDRQLGDLGASRRRLAEVEARLG
jgi:hypothetical protein